MVIGDFRERCCGCHACLWACPSGAISTEEDGEGFAYPTVDRKKCVLCGKCASVCPVLRCETVTAQKEKEPSCYSFTSNNSTILHNSSSGGAFTELANFVIAAKGVVYGCALDGQFLARHIRIDAAEDLKLLQGSKYIQSDLGDSFKKCKSDLENDVLVLFSGTPCQILALWKFLGKEYANLILVDVICHGVPSPKVWKHYLDGLSSRFGHPVKKVSFRDKSVSWDEYALSVKFGGCEAAVLESVSRNAYLRAFVRDLCLRPSCYVCKIKPWNSGSDITLADFWRIKDVYPDRFTTKGVSAVIIHSGKGMDIARRLSECGVFLSAKLADILRANQAYCKSKSCPPGRKIFMARYKTHNMQGLVNRCLSGPFALRAFRKARRILHI